MAGCLKAKAAQLLLTPTKFPAGIRVHGDPDPKIAKV